MFSQLLKMSKKKIRVKFRVLDGKIHIKCLSVTPAEYEKIANTINRVISPDVLQNNFNASIDVTL